MADIYETVERFDDVYRAGDIEGALALCSADAQWHAVTPGTRWSGSHPIREYLTVILPGVADMDGYAVESWETEVLDELVIAKLPSTHGWGLMVFRCRTGS